MAAHKNVSGFECLYKRVFFDLFIIPKRKLNFLPRDNNFLIFLGTYEVHKIFLPMERAMQSSPNDWTWQEYPKGYKNDVWMRKHIKLLIEENYEKELNGIFYEFSIHGNHKVNKISCTKNAPNKYFSIMEKLLATYEFELFGNNDIQNKVYLKYEEKLNQKYN